jgi:predicted glutamine amidotransferase
MCRWVGYCGKPIRLEELLYEPPHSLIEQSRASGDQHLANADGFGVGWYGHRDQPGLFRSVAPAWGDRNFRDLCGQVTSRLFLAHVRAATGTAVQETNCHPFRHDNWIFVHNGFIADFHRLRRKLMLAIDPMLFSDVEGTTDSEVMFHLALTFGLADEPLTALERMAGFIEHVGNDEGVAEPLQMTLGVSDGERLYAVRYASGTQVPNTLWVTSSATSLHELYPDDARLKRFGEDARAVVSEPLSDLPGLWHEVPPAAAIVVQGGPDEERPFTPRPPA